MYMDYFNFRFKLKLEKSQDPKTTLLEHEERSHHQLNILLYGVLDSKNERQ